MGVQSHLERHRKQLNLFIRIYVLSFYLLHPLLGCPLEVVCDEGFSKSPARLYSCRSIIMTINMIPALFLHCVRITGGRYCRDVGGMLGWKGDPGPVDSTL